MAITWILVANESEARLLKTGGDGMVLVKKFDHPAGRKKDQEINSDRYGRTKNRIGTGRSAMDPKVTPRVHERSVFAHELSGFLDRELAQRHFERLVLVAPPHFLGEIKGTLSEPLKKCIAATLSKDLPASWLTDRELIQHLEESADLKL